MNDLSNMPIVTPMNDSQWVPDGSGITPLLPGRWYHRLWSPDSIR